MRLSSFLVGLLSIVSPASCRSSTSSPASADLTHKITIHEWPLASAKPAPLAIIAYSPSTTDGVVKSYYPPKVSLPSGSQLDPATANLTRIGFYSPNTGSWIGVVTDQSYLVTPSYQKTLTLHVGPSDGAVFYLEFHAARRSPTLPSPATAAAKKTKSSGKTSSAAEDIQVHVVSTGTGTSPYLSAPVLVDAQGNEPVAEVEKTFLQKYWWLFAGIALLAVVGGGDK